MEKKKTLFDRACGTSLHSRFVARADDLNRDLTDEEVIEEAKYQLEDIPYKGWDDPVEEAKAMREMKMLIRLGTKKKEEKKMIQISATSIDNFINKVIENLRQYGIDQAHSDVDPLAWYIYTNRASTDFLRALINSDAKVVANKLHKGGSYYDAIKRMKKYLKIKDEI